MGTEKHIIPDIVLFVNGLPLVVVECKSPAIPDPIGEAITQIMRYSNRRGVREGNEKLFWYNVFSIATSNQKAKYSTITGEPEHYNEWKDPYPYSLSDISDTIITSQNILIQGMLSKRNLLDILRSFTVFIEDPKAGVIKVVGRYQQFRAVKKILERLKTGKSQEEKGGIIWHTQGSGKSLTMMFTVREMYRHPEFRNYKIVFITDRKELERQLNETSRSIGFTINLANNIRELQALLRTDTPDLIMGMVHKFQERELETKFPVLNLSPNILIMIDEAHRTQYKLLGANLRASLPNAVRIAFTGTPIGKTEEFFGDYIDKYSIKQAVEDEVTVEIVYEGRVHSAEITNEEEANKRFEDVFKYADADVKEKILGRFTWRAYLEDENVIQDKARDMIEHYISTVFPNGFKAQVVTASRLAAIRYKKALENALSEKIEQLKTQNQNNPNLQTLERLKIGVVISGSPNDSPEFHPYTDPNEHERIIKSFKLPFDINSGSVNGDVGILVVQNMLITGFDAPIEQVMYLDNVLKEHNLLQAIARVNRVYKNKSVGYVVDYVGVFKHLKEALGIYADEDFEEITKVVTNRAKIFDDLKFIHNNLNEFFSKYGIEDWRNNIDECIDLLVDEEVRNEFIALVRVFNKAIDAALPDPEALNYLKDLKIVSFIKETARNRYRDDKLSIKDASRKIREIVEEFLISKGVDPKIPPTHLLDDKFILKTKQYHSDRTRAFELKSAIIDFITNHHEEDPELYTRFANKLKLILEEYKDNWEKIAKELEGLREEIKKGREAERNFGLDPRKEMPFLGLLKQELFGDIPVEKLDEIDIDYLVNLTNDILSVVRKEIQVVDFWNSISKQKRLKFYIVTHILGNIKKHGLIKDISQPYPLNNSQSVFQKRNEIAQKILELAYNILLL